MSVPLDTIADDIQNNVIPVSAGKPQPEPKPQQTVRGGPQTEVGKASSSQNALKHGFSSDSVHVPPSEAAAYERFRQHFHNEIQPHGAVDTILVDRVARNSWKLTRIAQEEELLVDLYRKLKAKAYDALDRGDQEEADGVAEVQVEVEKELKLLCRYEQAAERHFHKALNAIVRLRKHPELLQAPAPAPYGQPSYSPRRDRPSMVQPRTNPPAPNELPRNGQAMPKTTVEVGRNGASGAENERR